MADNAPLPVTTGSTRNAATDQVTYSGDVADVQLVRIVDVTGIEGSKTVTVPSFAVTGAFFQATQPISAASLPLPTGAGTEATLAGVRTDLGTDGTAPPTVLGTGTGVRGWLRSIYEKLTGTLAVTGAFFQATQPVSIAATVATTVSANGAVSTANSSAAALGISGVFTGTSEDVTEYADIRVSVFADVASATDGLQMQQSSNGTNWDLIDSYSVPAGTGKTFSIGVSAKFFRVMYTNGAAAQTAFRLQTKHHKVYSKGSSVRPQDARTNDNDMEEALGHLMGYNGVSWDRLRSTVANGLAVDVTRIGAALPTGANVIGGVTGTFWQATQPVSAAALPLPTGAATETTLAGVRTDIGTDGTTPPTVLGAGTGVRGWLRSIYEKLTGTLAVTGTFFQATQPVSAVSLPLPAGAATETTLAALNTKMPALGQAVMLSSQPVVIASNQSAVPVSGTFFQATQPVSGAFFQATQPVSLATNTPTLAAGAAIVGKVGIDQTTPGVTNQVTIQPSTLAVTVTAAANTAATLTLPAVAGQFHYITGIEIMRTATAALAGTATLVVTTTNLPGGLAWSFGNAMAAGGTQKDNTLAFDNPLKSSVVNTATTIVMPLPGAAVLWRANVYYYTAA